MFERRRADSGRLGVLPGNGKPVGEVAHLCLFAHHRSALQRSESGRSRTFIAERIRMLSANFTLPNFLIRW